MLILFGRALPGETHDCFRIIVQDELNGSGRHLLEIMQDVKLNPLTNDENTEFQVDVLISHEQPLPANLLRFYRIMALRPSEFECVLCCFGSMLLTKHVL